MSDKEKVLEVLSAEVLVSRTLYEFYLDDTTVYLTDGTSDITYDGKVYLSSDIKRTKMTQQIDGKPENLELTLTNRNQLWSAFIASRGNKINFRKCVIKEYFVEFPDLEPVVIFKGSLDSPQLNVGEFKIGVIRGFGEFNKSVPPYTYDVNCQWQLGDDNCKYDAGETYCDKTYLRCLYLGNIPNYGGHPSTASDSIVRKS